MLKPVLTILTGASRGLGAAMAEELLAPGARLLCISRQRHPTLDELARSAGADLTQWQRDLAHPESVARELAEWLPAQENTGLAEVRLINNAGVLGHVGPADGSSDSELSRAIRVGLEAPVLLAAAFVRGTAGWTIPRKVLNISSGLGRRAMAGSAVYCAAKAGMDHFSRAMALDEAERPNGVKVVSLAPGVIDTDMQVQLRSADASGFPDQARFLGLKEQNQLASPAGAAGQVLAWLARSDFGQDPIADVREA